MATLVIQQNAGASTSHDLNSGTTSIGRHPENTIVLEDRSVSSRHAEIIAVNALYTVRDLQSSNGTKVNGSRKREQPLKHGDIIFFGRVECRFHDQPVTGNAKSATPAQVSKDQLPPPLPLGRIGAGQKSHRAGLPISAGAASLVFAIIGWALRLIAAFHYARYHNTGLNFALAGLGVTLICVGGTFSFLAISRKDGTTPGIFALILTLLWVAERVVTASSDN